ncbi:MAG: DNA-directed RNA polymerase subunit omega [Lachnospirales bacterium]
MLEPSYAELMEVLNKDSEGDVTSRYTVVIAAAKRARQLIDGDEPMVSNVDNGKPVSIAVEEIRQGKIKVVPEGQGTVIKPKVNVAEEIKEELKSKSLDDNLEEDSLEEEEISEEIETEETEDEE